MDNILIIVAASAFGGFFYLYVAPMIAEITAALDGLPGIVQ